MIGGMKMIGLNVRFLTNKGTVLNGRIMEYSRFGPPRDGCLRLYYAVKVDGFRETYWIEHRDIVS